MGLSLLLAGPILRRSEQDRACVWLATSQSAKIKADVYVLKETNLLSDNKPLNKENLRCIGSCTEKETQADTVQLGDNLFISLISIKPLDELFPQDTLLFYDVIINDKNLDDMGLVNGPKSIVYQNLPLPSFFLAGRISRLIHGSCRKPHGPGDDTLVKADELLGETAIDLETRPPMLFLTGDQIYADDVAGPLIEHLIEYGEELTGWQEEIPEIGNPANISVYGRREVLKEADSGFTSTESSNHLMTFGEYAAMYLSVWSDESWSDSLTNIDPQKIGINKKRYEKENEALKRFQKTLKTVRRLFANIPTYMIFDDHEVTDDWNLHRQWFDSVRSGKSGRRIVSNALAAYWAFQGWGNSPEVFSTRFINCISGYLKDKGSNDNIANKFEQRLWNFHKWGFSLSSNPPTIAIDSRTQREYDSLKGPARLIDRYGLDWIRSAWAEVGGSEDQDLIIIAATPVYGFEPIERMQKIITSFGFPPTRLDRESWIANREGFGAFMRLLNCEIRPKQCIILSGDVHYAFSSSATFNSNGQSLTVKQLTSSAIKNEPKSSKLLNWLGKLSDREEHRMGWQPDTPGSKRLARPIFELLVRYNFLESTSNEDIFWSDTVSGIRKDQEEGLLFTSNNVGLVHLQEDGSIIHELLTESNNITYKL